MWVNQIYFPGFSCEGVALNISTISWVSDANVVRLKINANIQHCSAAVCVGQIADLRIDRSCNDQFC